MDLSEGQHRSQYRSQHRRERQSISIEGENCSGGQLGTAPKPNAQKDETPDIAVGGLQEKSGGVLLSHKVSLAVPLALASLTSEFEMGSGVTSPL